jgi:hypothetical protein
MACCTCVSCARAGKSYNIHLTAVVIMPITLVDYRISLSYQPAVDHS